MRCFSLVQSFFQNLYFMRALKAALLVFTISITSLSFAQTNTIPTNGNVGIGTLTPSAKLDVNGKMIVDSLVILKDSVYVQKKMEVEEDMKIKGTSVFVDDGKFKSELKVLGVARMKNDVVVDGLTKMNGDAKVFGDFKIKSLEDLGLTDDRFLMIQPNGKTVGLNKAGLLGVMYSPQSLCLADVNGNVLSSWAQVPNPNYGILYTGVGPANCQTKVGIGTNAPQARLDVRGTGYFSQNVQVGDASTGLYVGNAGSHLLGDGTSYIGFNAKRVGSTTGIWSTNGNGSANGGATIYGDIYGALRFSTIPKTGGVNQVGVKDTDVKKNTRLFIHQDGSVGVGTEAPTARLTVNAIADETVLSINKPSLSEDVFRVTGDGVVFATRVRVRTIPFPDYVFDSSYELIPLTQLENYITKNKHLPNMPTANEVEEDGMDIGEVNRVLVEKVEELTLYMIAMDKRMKQLEEENKALRK